LRDDALSVRFLRPGERRHHEQDSQEHMKWEHVFSLGQIHLNLSNSAATADSQLSSTK
jgi:hypothetical protein